MARVKYPESAIDTTRVDLELRHPGQAVIRGAFSNKVTVLNRSSGYWAGTLHIGPTTKFADAQAIEAWIASMQGQGNVCDFKFQRDDPLLGEPQPMPRVASNANTLAGIEVTINRDWSSLGVGYYVRNAGRVYIVTKVVSSRRFILAPQRNLKVGATFNRANLLRIRLANTTSPSMPRSPDWWGPWVIDFEEGI